MWMLNNIHKTEAEGPDDPADQQTRGFPGTQAFFMKISLLIKCHLIFLYSAHGNSPQYAKGVMKSTNRIIKMNMAPS